MLMLLLLLLMLMLMRLVVFVVAMMLSSLQRGQTLRRRLLPIQEVCQSVCLCVDVCRWCLAKAKVMVMLL